MKRILLFFMTVSALVFINQACSSDDSGGGNQPTVTSITLVADNASVSVGETITYTVKTNTGTNVTSSASITVNGNAISGNTFTPSAAGSYAAKATYNNLTSNTITGTATAGEFTSITLSLSDTEVQVGNAVTFTAMGDNGADLTNQATFTVDGVAVSGNSYTATTAATYYVRARIGTISSNQESFVAKNPQATSIEVIASDESAFWGDNVSLTVKDNFGTDITSQATIYVDGSEWNGSYLTSDVDASFECYATFEDLTSETITVTFIQQPATFLRNVLIEDFTGTWCGNCPRVSHAIEEVEALTDDVFAVGIHGGGADPYIRVNVNELANLIELPGYPTAMIDRMTNWTYPESSNLDDVTSIAGTEANLGLALSTSHSSNTVTTEVKVSYAEDYSQDLELVVYLVENGLVYDQANYYENLYGGQNPIPDFVHNGVLSDVYTALLGDDMPAANGGDEYTVTLTDTLTSSIEDSDNLYVVAFVIDAATNDCLNVQWTKLGESQGYEYYE